MMARWKDRITAVRVATTAAFALGLFFAVPSRAAQIQATPGIQVTVLNEASQPVAGVRIDVSAAGALVGEAVTDSGGHAIIHCSPNSSCVATVKLAGFQTVEAPVQESDTSLQIQLVSQLKHDEMVTVRAESADPLAVEESGQSKLSVAEATQTPLRPATLADALPLVPGVVRLPDGQVSITGLGEQHSVLIINAVDVTDPATGSFGLSVPIDSVQDVKVLQSPYLAEYGNFTAGVVSAETRRGGDKWAYSLNDPLPDVRIRSGHLVGVRAETPFPVNQSKSTAFNSYTQLDAPLTASQTFTATLHFVPRTLQFMDLNYFDPEAVTPNADYHEDTGTMTHRLGFAGGLLASTFAYTRVASDVTPQVPGDMTLSPIGDSGSYFSQQGGESTRVQWLETWTPRIYNWHGQHALQAGAVLAHAEDEGNVSAQPVHLTDANGNPLQDITYSGRGDYDLADMEPAVYLQDHWIATKQIAFDAGVRWEAQSITSTVRVAPRAGITWTPFKNSQSTVVRGGMGAFYDEVPLNVYAFRGYPQQTVTTYNASGNMIDGPRLFYNFINTDPNLLPGLDG
jgi:hypothetical protein